MNTSKILKGKKILIVDDETDILDSLIEILNQCKLDTASSFEAAKKQLVEKHYDLAILDIMGVDGFNLLEIASDHNIPALMLTAHALTENSLKKSAQKGAAYFVPKDKMADIDIYIADVFKALEKNQSTWDKFSNRLGGFFDKRFNGTNWREQEEKFGKDIIKQPY